MPGDVTLPSRQTSAAVSAASSHGRLPGGSGDRCEAAGGCRSRDRDVHHACRAVDSGVMRSSEGAITNLSSTGETITETATIPSQIA